MINEPSSFKAISNKLIELSFLFSTAQTTPGPSQNMDYTPRDYTPRATTCHECTVLT